MLVEANSALSTSVLLSILKGKLNNFGPTINNNNNFVVLLTCHYKIKWKINNRKGMDPFLLMSMMAAILVD